MRVDSSRSSPWMNVRDAATRARCGTRQIRSAVRAGKLKAASLGGRRELRFLAAWVDDWIKATAAVAPSETGARS